jgi:hypothetical protein
MDMKYGFGILCVLSLIAAASAEGCGNVGAEGLTLTNDWTVTSGNLTSSVCLRTTANNAIIDCNGHYIHYNEGMVCESYHQFLSVSNSNVVLKNCNLSGFTYFVRADYVNNLTLDNNQIDSIGLNSYEYKYIDPNMYQVYLDGVDNFTITNNKIYNAKVVGLRLYNTTTSFSISNNIFKNLSTLDLSLNGIENYQTGFITFLGLTGGTITNNTFESDKDVNLQSFSCQEEYNPEISQTSVIGGIVLRNSIFSYNWYGNAVAQQQAGIYLHELTNVSFINENMSVYNGTMEIGINTNNTDFTDTLPVPLKQNFFIKRLPATHTLATFIP